MGKAYVYVFIVSFFFSTNHVKSQVRLHCDKKHSAITYSMSHPLHSWKGENKDVTSLIIMDENSNIIKQVAVSVKVASFNSNNANRDSHMIEVTEALLYPTITFESTSIEQIDEKLEVTGTLVFHGVKQVVTFEAIKKMLNKNKIEVSGNFSIRMTQFNIEPPSLMGMQTDDDIKLFFDITYQE